MQSQPIVLVVLLVALGIWPCGKGMAPGKDSQAKIKAIKINQGEELTLTCRKRQDGKVLYLLWYKADMREGVTSLFVARNKRITPYGPAWAKKMSIEETRQRYTYTIPSVSTRVNGIFRCGDGRGPATAINVITSKILTSQIMARSPSQPNRTVRAYDCTNGTIRHVGQLTDLGDTAISELLRTGIIIDQNKPGNIKVLLERNVFELACDRIIALRILSDVCYHNEAMKVRLSDGRIAVIDSLNFIISNAAEVSCLPDTHKNLERIIGKAIMGLNMRQAIISTGVALTNRPYLEATRLFSDDQLEHLNRLLEKCLYGDNIFLTFKLIYNKYFAGALLLYGCCYFCYIWFLFIVTLSLKVSFKDAFRIACPTFKRTREAIEACRKVQAIKRQKDKENMRVDMGLEPKANLEEVTSFHLGEIYMGIDNHSARLAKIEKKLKTKRGSWTKRMSRVIKAQRKGDQNSYHSSSSSSSSEEGNSKKRESSDSSVNIPKKIDFDVREANVREALGRDNVSACSFPSI